jgi:signal transduction histidine kinase
MFKSARIKLTLWYLLIIVVISLCFSVLFYGSASQEIDRLITKAQVDTTNQKVGDSNIGAEPAVLNIDELERSKNSLLVQIGVINLAVIALSGASGYFLAGRTLRPIKQMVDDQNRFITDSSHEIRTPLAAIGIAMEGLLRHKHISDTDARAMIKTSMEEVGSLNTLSDRLIQLMHVHKDTRAPLEIVEFEDLVERAKKKVLPLAKAREITIVEDTVPAHVVVSSQNMTELLTILLDNAIKYSPNKTRVVISTRVHDDTLLVRIVDRGIGIAAEDLPHIFDRFYRGDKARVKTETSGYGLGLSIAKQIVESYKGSIHVKSEVDTGTVFSIKLPVLSDS